MAQSFLTGSQNIFDGAFHDRRVCLINNYIALGEWELARGLIQSLFAHRLQELPSNQDDSASYASAEKSLYSTWSNTSQKPEGGDAGSGLVVEHDSATNSTSAAEICCYCRVLRGLQSLAAVGPPNMCVPSTSVPSSADLSQLCAKTLHNIIVGVSAPDPANCLLSNATEVKHDKFRLFRVPVWAQLRCAFDIVLARAILDSALFYPCCTVEWAETLIHLRNIVCILLALGILRAYTTETYEDVRSVKCKSYDTEVLPCCPFGYSWCCIKQQNVFYPGVGFVPALSLLRVPHSMESLGLPAALSRLPSRVIVLSRVSWLFIAEGLTEDEDAAKSTTLPVNAVLVERLERILACQPHVGWTLMLFVRVILQLSLGQLSVSEACRRLGVVDLFPLPSSGPSKTLFEALGREDSEKLGVAKEAQENALNSRLQRLGHLFSLAEFRAAATHLVDVFQRHSSLLKPVASSSSLMVAKYPDTVHRYRSFGWLACGQAIVQHLVFQKRLKQCTHNDHTSDVELAEKIFLPCGCEMGVWESIEQALRCHYFWVSKQRQKESPLPSKSQTAKFLASQGPGLDCSTLSVLQLFRLCIAFAVSGIEMGRASIRELITLQQKPVPAEAPESKFFSNTSFLCDVSESDIFDSGLDKYLTRLFCLLFQRDKEGNAVNAPQPNSKTSVLTDVISVAAGPHVSSTTQQSCPPNSEQRRALVVWFALLAHLHANSDDCSQGAARSNHHVFLVLRCLDRIQLEWCRVKARFLTLSEQLHFPTSPYRKSFAQSRNRFVRKKNLLVQKSLALFWLHYVTVTPQLHWVTKVLQEYLNILQAVAQIVEDVGQGLAQSRMRIKSKVTLISSLLHPFPQLIPLALLMAPIPVLSDNRKTARFTLRLYFMRKCYTTLWDVYAASGLRGDALLEAVVHSDVSSWRIAKVLALYLEHQNAHSSFCSLKEKPLEKLRTSATVADTYLSGPLDHPITRFPRSHTMPLAAHYETVVAKKALRDDLYLALKGSSSVLLRLCRHAPSVLSILPSTVLTEMVAKGGSSRLNDHDLETFHLFVLMRDIVRLLARSVNGYEQNSVEEVRLPPELQSVNELAVDNDDYDTSSSVSPAVEVSLCNALNALESRFDSIGERPMVMLCIAWILSFPFLNCRSLMPKDTPGKPPHRSASLSVPVVEELLYFAERMTQKMFVQEDDLPSKEYLQRLRLTAKFLCQYAKLTNLEMDNICYRLGCFQNSACFKRASNFQLFSPGCASLPPFAPHQIKNMPFSSFCTPSPFEALIRYLRLHDTASAESMLLFLDRNPAAHQAAHIAVLFANLKKKLNVLAERSLDCTSPVNVCVEEICNFHLGVTQRAQCSDLKTLRAQTPDDVDRNNVVVAFHLIDAAVGMPWASAEHAELLLFSARKRLEELCHAPSAQQTPVGEFLDPGLIRQLKGFIERLLVLMASVRSGGNNLAAAQSENRQISLLLQTLVSAELASPTETEPPENLQSHIIRLEEHRRIIELLAKRTVLLFQRSPGVTTTEVSLVLPPPLHEDLLQTPQDADNKPQMSTEWRRILQDVSYIRQQFQTQHADAPKSQAHSSSYLQRFLDYVILMLGWMQPPELGSEKKIGSLFPFLAHEPRDCIRYLIIERLRYAEAILYASVAREDIWCLVAEAVFDSDALTDRPWVMSTTTSSELSSTYLLDPLLYQELAKEEQKRPQLPASLFFDSENVIHPELDVSRNFFTMLLDYENPARQSSVALTDSTGLTQSCPPRQRLLLRGLQRIMHISSATKHRGGSAVAHHIADNDNSPSCLIPQNTENVSNNEATTTKLPQLPMGESKADSSDKTAPLLHQIVPVAVIQHYLDASTPPSQALTLLPSLLTAGHLVTGSVWKEALNNLDSRSSFATGIDLLCLLQLVSTFKTPLKNPGLVEQPAATALLKARNFQDAELLFSKDPQVFTRLFRDVSILRSLHRASLARLGSLRVFDCFFTTFLPEIERQWIQGGASLDEAVNALDVCRYFGFFKKALRQGIFMICTALLRFSQVFFPKCESQCFSSNTQKAAACPRIYLFSILNSVKRIEAWLSEVKASNLQCALLLSRCRFIAPFLLQAGTLDHAEHTFASTTLQTLDDAHRALDALEVSVLRSFVLQGRLEAATDACQKFVHLRHSKHRAAPERSLEFHFNTLCEAWVEHHAASLPAAASAEQLEQQANRVASFLQRPVSPSSPPMSLQNLVSQFETPMLLPQRSELHAFLAWSRLSQRSRQESCDDAVSNRLAVAYYERASKSLTNALEGTIPTSEFKDVRRNQTLQIVKKQTSAADAACGTNDAIRWLVKRRCFEDAVHLGIEAVSQEALLSSTSHNDATSFQPETCFIFSFSGFDVLRRYGALIHPVATLLLTYVRFSKEKKLEAACAFRCLRNLVRFCVEHRLLIPQLQLATLLKLRPFEACLCAEISVSPLIDQHIRMVLLHRAIAAFRETFCATEAQNVKMPVTGLAPLATAFGPIELEATRQPVAEDTFVDLLIRSTNLGGRRQSKRNKAESHFASYYDLWFDQLQTNATNHSSAFFSKMFYTASALFDHGQQSSHLISILTGQPLAAAVLLKCVRCLQLELEMVEAVADLPRHYTLLLDDVPWLRTRILEQLLHLGGYSLAGQILSAFHITDVFEIGVKCLFDASRHHAELLCQGQADTEQSLEYFFRLILFFQSRLSTEDFERLKINVTEFWSAAVSQQEVSDAYATFARIFSALPAPHSSDNSTLCDEKRP